MFQQFPISPKLSPGRNHHRPCVHVVHPQRLPKGVAGSAHLDCVRAGLLLCDFGDDRTVFCAARDAADIRLNALVRSRSSAAEGSSGRARGTFLNS